MELDLTIETLPNFILPIINDIAIKEGFSNPIINIENGTNIGDGFIGIIFKVTIGGERQSIKNITQEVDQLKLICKVSPNNKRCKEFSVMKFFEREIYMYNNVIPEFNKFQLEKGIKEGDAGFFGYPKIFYSNFDSEKDEAVIIMEDLKEIGYEMYSKFISVDFQHARQLFIELGRFHAVSIAIKDQKPEIFEKYKELKDIMGNTYTSEQMRPFINANCERAIKTLLPHEDYKKEKLIKLRNDMNIELENCLNSELAEPYAVLNHGDCWLNNMMFSYRGGSPQKICLIDWQISRYCTPATDIVHFIFCCTDKAFRDEHYDNLLQIYYKSFREHLERLGGDSNNLFPFTALLRQLKLFGKFGLCMALFFIPFLCTENDDLPNINKYAENVKNDIEPAEKIKISEKNECMYNERMGDVIRDMIRLGYL